MHAVFHEKTDQAVTTISDVYDDSGEDDLGGSEADDHECVWCLNLGRLPQQSSAGRLMPLVHAQQLRVSREAERSGNVSATASVRGHWQGPRPARAHRAEQQGHAADQADVSSTSFVAELNVELDTADMLPLKMAVNDRGADEQEPDRVRGRCLLRARPRLISG